jgi:hypothetical protein
MLKGALDFWMEPPQTYEKILVAKTDSEKDIIKKEKSQEEIEGSRSITGTGICWFVLPEQPLNYHLFLSIRGSENFHLYLWLIKDLSWAQSWYYSGHIFGSLAVIWSFFILFHAARERNTNEAFVGVAQTAWLMANVWWMTGIYLYEYIYICVCVNTYKYVYVYIYIYMLHRQPGLWRMFGG